MEQMIVEQMKLLVDIRIVIACLILGYCIKHIKWLNKLSNEYIPAILALFGIIVICFMYSFKVDTITIISGALSGLLSTGLHQFFKKIIERKDNDNEYGF